MCFQVRCEAVRLQVQRRVQVPVGVSATAFRHPWPLPGGHPWPPRFALTPTGTWTSDTERVRKKQTDVSVCFSGRITAPETKGGSTGFCNRRTPWMASGAYMEVFTACCRNLYFPLEPAL